MQYSLHHQLDEKAIARTAQVQRLRVFNERSITGAISALAGIALLGWLMWAAAGGTRALTWTGLMTAIEVAILFAGVGCRRVLDRQRDAEIWKRSHFILAGLAGVGWGSAVWFVWTGGNVPAYLVAMVILMAVAGISMVTMSSYAVAALAFFGGIYLMPMLHALLHDSTVSRFMQIGLPLGLLVQLGYARELGKVVLRDVEQNARNEALVERLHELVLHDQLTGAYSRRHMFEQMERLVSLRQRHGSSATAILFDLDHFKGINDQYGHPAGDRALCEAVHAASAQLRGGDLLGRVGGEEFLILLPLTDLAAAMPLAERLRQTLAEASITEGSARVRLPASFGVAELKSTESHSEWFRRTDAALYAAKEHGRNSVVAAA